MKIELDEYIISNIPLNIVIERKIKRKSRQGEEYEGLEHIGYYSSYSLDSAILSLLDEKISRSNATTLEELRLDLEKAKSELSEGIKNCRLISDVKGEFNKEHIDKYGEPKEKVEKPKTKIKKLDKPKPKKSKKKSTKPKSTGSKPKTTKSKKSSTK